MYADPDTQTCTDCEIEGRNSPFLRLVITQIPRYRYQCSDNIRSGKLLTSGYINDCEEKYDEEWVSVVEMIEKPSGKCSHG